MYFYHKYKPLLALNSGMNVIALTGGRMSGKTTHALIGILLACVQSKKRVCLFRETKDTLNESLIAEIKNLIETYFPNRGFVCSKEQIRHMNGSYIFFKGLKEVNRAAVENLKGIASSTDIFVVDEAQAVSKPVWDVLIPTLRKDGCVLIVMYNRIADNLPVEEALFLDYENKTAPEGTYFVEVNYPELVPFHFISQAALQRAELLKRNKPAEYKMIYLNQPPDLSDLAVVKYWSKENIVDVPYDPKQDLLLAMDFNVDPMMWCVCQKTDNSLHCLDEIVVENTTTSDAAQEFLHRYPDHQAGIILCGDASGNYRKTQSNLSDYALVKNALYRHGIDPKRVIQQTRAFNPPIIHRIHAFNQLVLSDDGKRHFTCSPRCHWLIYNMKNLKYKKGTSLMDLPTPAQISANEELKFLGHIYDAISYPAEYYWPIHLKQPQENKQADPAQEWIAGNVFNRVMVANKRSKW